MLWILIIHIITMLIWIASVLYLPILIASESNEQRLFNEPPFQFGSVARLVFTYIAGPAAILAIIAGTVVFVLNDTRTVWLMAKLTVVTLLTVLHACLGLLVTRLEHQQMQYLSAWSWIFLAAIGLCVMAIFWLVLAKPELSGALPWAF